MSRVPGIAVEELRDNFFLSAKIQPIEKIKKDLKSKFSFNYPSFKDYEDDFKTLARVDTFQEIDFLWELALTAESDEVRKTASDLIAVLYTS